MRAAAEQGIVAVRELRIEYGAEWWGPHGVEFAGPAQPLTHLEAARVWQLTTAFPLRPVQGLVTLKASGVRA